MIVIDKNGYLQILSIDRVANVNACLALHSNQPETSSEQKSEQTRGSEKFF